MPNPLFNFFSEQRKTTESAFLNNQLPCPKKYPSALRTPLAVPEKSQLTLSDLLAKRKSQRDFSGHGLAMDDLSFLLYWSTAEDVALVQDESGTFRRRPYPSGGAKFPIETYIVTDEHTELGTAAYHYRPDIHELEHVADLTTERVQEIKKTYGYTFVASAPVLILFTYIRERNLPKYGLFGEKLALIEAGHIAQNMYLCATERDVSVVSLGGGGAELADVCLQLDSYNESVFYTLAAGKPN